MTASVRFVHAADLHLAAPFKGVDAADPRVRDALVRSTYEALESLVDVCLAQEVDFLVLAGDVYNSAERSLTAEAAFRRACERLAEAGIGIYVAHGNHDPAGGRTHRLDLPGIVHVFSASEVERVVFERDGEAVCALYGRSYRTSAETGNLARGFARDASDPLAIGVLHANVGGRPGHEPYAPCSVDDLRAAGMDYWALGHIHKAEVISEDPAIVYAGCTQGLQPNESGLKGCRVVTLTPAGAEIESVPTSAVVWSTAEVDVTDVDGIADVERALAQAVARAAADAEGRPVVLRAVLTGRAPVHADLVRPAALKELSSEVRAAALERSPWVWVDRVTDRTRPVVDLDALRSSELLAGDVVRIADTFAGDVAALEALVAEVSGPVLGALDRAEVAEPDAAALLERARDIVLDRLLAGEDA